MTPLPDQFEQVAKMIVDEFGQLQNGTSLTYTHSSELVSLITNALRSAVEKEREECAKIAEETTYIGTENERVTALIQLRKRIAAAIRGRKA